MEIKQAAKYRDRRAPSGPATGCAERRNEVSRLMLIVSCATTGVPVVQQSAARKNNLYNPFLKWDLASITCVLSHDLQLHLFNVFSIGSKF
jgi:hypothetical protein